MLVAMPETAGPGRNAPATGPPPEPPARQFGWWDMFVPPEEDPREEPAEVTDERGTLVRYLRDQRLTLELKCAGLDAAAMARRSVEPSNLSLLGLVRHLTRVEQTWFRRVLAGQAVPRLYPDGTDFDGAVPDPAAVAQAWDGWRAEVAFAEQFVAGAPDLDVTGTCDNGTGGQSAISLRSVLAHMIEEYARHNGHADFLRERIDGRVGQ